MEFLPLPAAVKEIAARSVVTEAVARGVLIATFMTGQATAVCDAYWRRAIVGGRALPSPAPDEDGVPADFWHLNHANVPPVDADYVTSGYSGQWSATANFTNEFCLSSEWASLRFPEFTELRQYGSQPVDIQFCAMDVRICPADLEAIIERGKRQRQFDALIKKANRKPSITHGNLSKSDSERLWARLCCNFLFLSHQHQLATNPDKVLDLVRSTVSNVSEESAVSDRMMRRIADLIAEEALRIAGRRGPPV
jgi:hypothetical protein